MLARLLLAAALSVTVVHAEEKATSFSADISGIWYIPAENGWGMNIIQQSQTLFVTLFIYDSSGRPTWLVGSAVEFQNSTNGFLFSGPLYQTAGAYFGGPWNPAALGVTQVGTISVRFPSYYQAQVTYTANGVTVNKTLIPQTFRVNNLAGSYLGGLFGNSASCVLPIPQASGTLIGMDVTHNSAGVASFRFTGTNGNSCTFTGAVTASGKLLDVDGTYTCTASPGGQFAMRRLEASIDGISGAIVSLSASGCSAVAVTMGGARVSF
jgi:hypothetical protein